MKKIRRFLTVLLFINFFMGMAHGMKAWELALVIANGLLVTMLVVKEIKKGRQRV